MKKLFLTLSGTYCPVNWLKESLTGLGRLGLLLFSYCPVNWLKESLTGLGRIGLLLFSNKAGDTNDGISFEEALLLSFGSLIRAFKTLSLPLPARKWGFGWTEVQICPPFSSLIWVYEPVSVTFVEASLRLPICSLWEAKFELLEGKSDQVPRWPSP